MEVVFASDPISDSSELWLERVLTNRAQLHVVPPASRRSDPSSPSTERVKLSRRELEIVRCIASGMRNFEIAERLGIGEQTVKNHLHKAFQKTGVRDRLEMALYAVYHGIYLM
jgi:DNA-binding NarL/FixJ family response regulator